MLLNPWILAQLLGATLVCGVTVVAAFQGLLAVRGWEPNHWGPRQLAREHRLLLVEATLKVALGCQLVSLFLFVATAERLHPLFPGAMCAAGTLDASRFGYPTLGSKVAVFLLCGLWLLLHRATRGIADTTVIRAKHLFVVALAGAMIGESVLQARYFADLQPQVLTSCCATIFGTGAGNLASDLAALPPGASRAGFFTLLALTVAAGFRCRGQGRSPALFAGLAVALGAVAAAAVVSWVAPGFYRSPTHHCPFCLLKPEMSYVGYPLYLFLLGAVVTGAASGLVHLLGRLDASASRNTPEARRLCILSMVGFGLFALLAVWPWVTSDFRLGGP